MIWGKNQIWTTISLIVGAVILVGGISNPADPFGLDSGPMIILAAIACRMATTRRIVFGAKTTIRILFELILMGAVIFLWLFKNNLKNEIAYHPWENLIFPVWAITAYLIAFFRALGGVQKKCPHCAQRIKHEATACRFCGRDVKEAQSA